MNDMKERATELRHKKATLTRELREVTDRLGQIENTCQHQWGETTYAPEPVTSYEPDYSRPPMTQGIHLDYHTRPVVRQKPTWVRECKVCGMVQKTTNVRQEAREVPQF